MTLPKPMTSGAKSEGRLGKQDFVYLPDEDVYSCLAGGRLTYRYSNEEDGKEATLLDDGVLKLPSQASVHYRPRAADYAMGERACARSCAAAARCQPERHAPAARDGRASVRNH